MPKRLAVGAAAAVALVAGIWMYGHYQYRQGVADTETAARLAQADTERRMQDEKDRADAEYRSAVAQRDVAATDLDTVQRELERVLSDLRSAQAASASDRLNAASAGRLEGFAACVGEYGNLAKDAARWADQVNGLQGYVRALR